MEGDGLDLFFFRVLTGEGNVRPGFLTQQEDRRISPGHGNGDRVHHQLCMSLLLQSMGDEVVL